MLGCRTLCVDYVDKLVVVEHVGQFGSCLNGMGRAERNLQLVGVSFLGSDDDDTVRCARSVDGG